MSEPYTLEQQENGQYFIIVDEKKILLGTDSKVVGEKIMILMGKEPKE